MDISRVVPKYQSISYARPYVPFHTALASSSAFPIAHQSEESISPTPSIFASVRGNFSSSEQRETFYSKSHSVPAHPAVVMLHRPTSRQGPVTSDGRTMVDSGVVFPENVVKIVASKTRNPSRPHVKHAPKGGGACLLGSHGENSRKRLGSPNWMIMGSSNGRDTVAKSIANTHFINQPKIQSHSDNYLNGLNRLHNLNLLSYKTANVRHFRKALKYNT
mmetsp:Transcript_21269/g.29488  ORF Transcript_21269/g.29488 Transcript_21269/m.29488 type:complete len:219 (+) Transcript_21269:3-659(+)